MIIGLDAVSLAADHALIAEHKATLDLGAAEQLQHNLSVIR